MTLKCFVIMPFDPAFDDVYQLVCTSVESAVPGELIQTRRLDEIRAAGRISHDLMRELQESAVCIGDLTGCNPNVMWEVGYAMATQKPTLLLTQDIKTLAFDIKDWRTIEYQRQSLAQTLRPKLEEAFRETLGRYEVRAKSRQTVIPAKSRYTIAVTGSMDAEINKLQRRIEALTKPYLSTETEWLVGSNGRSDEIALESLAKCGQRITVVGYHAFDISPTAAAGEIEGLRRSGEARLAEPRDS